MDAELTLQGFGLIIIDMQVGGCERRGGVKA